jgi:hypothetical protein
MTPLLTTRHHWRVGFGSTPPPELPGDFDVVRVGTGLGMCAIDTMIDTGDRVGPLLYCTAHRLLLIPVEAGTADRWCAAHSACSSGSALRCGRQGYQSLCRSRIWLTPPEPLLASTTAPAVLHDTLSLMRARMRGAARQPFRMRARGVCHL